jgi:DNA-binding NtrC family response regulator
MNINTTVRSVRHWMLVDDDEIILALLQYLISTISDAQTHCFHSATQAFRAFKEGSIKYEAVFTDFNMPEMNGIELCQRLQQSAPGLKVVLATGSVEISEAQTIGHGFCALVRKPYSMDALRHAVDEIRKFESNQIPVWELDSVEAA